MSSDPVTADQHLASGANLLSHLANPKRLLVCTILSCREEDVGSLARQVGLSQSALSQHLIRLHRAGILKVRRQTQFRYYSCDHPGVFEILGLLEQIFGNEPEEEITRVSFSDTPSWL